MYMKIYGKKQQKWSNKTVAAGCNGSQNYQIIQHILVLGGR